jgi:hypothetical protein
MPSPGCAGSPRCRHSALASGAFEGAARRIIHECAHRTRRAADLNQRDEDDTLNWIEAVFEFDAPGKHTLKHLAATEACFTVLRYFQTRTPIV